ncbi:MAG TPA: DUF3108 domain-containing protein [Verrucomicrobiae bacterium]|nr:DUF3108 domain-containing protein [Verrucomicrobiae bacterium]
MNSTINGRGIRRRAALAAVFLGLVAAARLAPLSAQSQPRNTAKAKVAAVSPPKEQPMPFHPGETLNYRVSWSAFSSAASLQLAAPERRNLFGWQTWHFRGEAHTLNTVRSLFSIDDQFDSYTDAATLESRQFEQHLNEMGKSKNDVQRLAANGQPARAPAPLVMVLPGTRDVLGALYALRGVDWQRTPEVRAPVYDGRNVFDMHAARETADDPVKVPAGTYSASRVAVRVFQNEKEVSAIHVVIWIASDAPRTPVQLQADLPFGSLRAELTSALQ